MAELGKQISEEFVNGRPRCVIDRLRVASEFTPDSGLGLLFVENEIPTGTINGAQRVFTLANAPNPTTSLKVYSDGVRIDTSQFTISSTTLTFIAGSVNIPQGSLLVDYRY